MRVQGRAISIFSGKEAVRRGADENLKVVGVDWGLGS